MTSIPYHHYSEPGFNMSPVFVPDDVYAQVMDSFVIVCADAVIVDYSAKILYLARRVAKPAATWWFMGGRLRPAETPEDAIRRNFKRETSLDLPAERFKLISLNRYWFADRNQPPQSKSCDTLGFAFAVELTPDERAVVAANLDPAEYDQSAGLQPFDRQRLTHEKIRQPIFDLYNLVFSNSHE